MFSNLSNFKFTSKTLWLNVIAIALLVAKQAGYEVLPLDADQAGMVLAISNFILRFMTREPLVTPPAQPAQ